jgi:Terminase large subunit, T4likevirus-type, N-terminal
VSTASLRAEVSRLRGRHRDGDPNLPHDPVEFARSLGIEPDAWQEDLLRSTAPRILLNITRQGGKSTMAAIMALHQALTTPRSLVLILAPSERQAKETFGKAAALYRHDVPADSYRKLGMQLRNGSRIEALPGSERTIRGFSGVDLLILDEAARIDDGLYYAVAPMLAVSGGRMIMLSTPYGRRGIFHAEWTDGVGWERYEVPATECPRIPASFLENERQSMPEWWFAQEFGCEFRETEDQIFTNSMIEAARDDELPEYRFEGDENLWS